MNKEELKELSRKFNNELASQLSPSNDSMVAVRTARKLFEEYLTSYTAELKNIIEEAHQAGREEMKQECLGAVPWERESHKDFPFLTPDAEAWNSCREQTINNITKIGV